jgi:hypothetical protein
MDYYTEESIVKVKGKVLAVTAVFAAFVASGPLQHVGALPQTVVGDASKAMIKAILNQTSTDAYARCGGGGGGKGNNGFGNGGGDGVPGSSGKQDSTR